MVYKIKEMFPWLPSSRSVIAGSRETCPFVRDLSTSHPGSPSWFAVYATKSDGLARISNIAKVIQDVFVVSSSDSVDPPSG